MKINFKGEMASVIAIMGMGTLAMSILGPIMPLYLTSIGVEPVVLGFMLSVSMAGMAIGESSWGLVADRIGIKLPMVVGTYVCALSVLLLIFTRSVPAIFVIFFFWGFVRSALFGPGRGYIGASAPSLKKATFMAISTIMLSASRSLGALPSGFMVDFWGYHSVFLASSGITLLAGLLVVTSLRRTQPVNPAASSVTPSPADEPVYSDNKFNYFSLSPQCIVTTLRFLGLGALGTFLPLLATQVVGVGATEVGILFTITGLVTVVLGIPMGMLADRIGKKLVMTLGLLVSAGAMAGIAYAQSFPLLIVFSAINSTGMAMFSPAALGLLSASVPLNRQSTAMGLYGGICENAGIVAGSALAGVVWSTWGPQPTFLMGTVATGLAAVICFALVREKAS
ncbi:MFS transporter [Chloroflexota bacterium]